MAIPETITVTTDGIERTYVATVLKVETKNVRGVARTLRHIEREETISLRGGEEFAIVYYPADMLKGDIK